MNRRILSLTFAGIACMALAVAADTTDKITSLPIHPGLTFDQEVDSPVCGKDAQMNLYSLPRTSPATLAEFVSWYKGQLKGFHYVHKVWGDRPQDMFYSPDGATGVSVTGMPKGPGVYAVTYMKFSAHLTTHQMDAFDPSNPTCK